MIYLTDSKRYEEVQNFLNSLSDDTHILFTDDTYFSKIVLLSNKGIFVSSKDLYLPRNFVQVGTDKVKYSHLVHPGIFTEGKTPVLTKENPVITKLSDKDLSSFDIFFYTHLSTYTHINLIIEIIKDSKIKTIYKENKPNIIEIIKNKLKNLIIK